MGLVQEVRQEWQALVNSGNIRYFVLPQGVIPLGAAGVALTHGGADGAWAWGATVALCAAGVASGQVDPEWLVGIAVVLSAVAATTTQVDIGIGLVAVAAGLAGADLCVIPWSAQVVTTPDGGPYNLPYPIRIVGMPIIYGRQRDTLGTVANTAVSIKLLMASAIGT